MQVLTSTLVAAGFGCPGETQRLIIGLFIAYQATGQAEINYCDDKNKKKTKAKIPIKSFN